MADQSSPIWVLLGTKAGDNAQVLRLAKAVDLPFETKTLAMRPEFETGKPDVADSLHHLDLAASDRLAPPWPRLVLTIGRRLSMAALWIKQQSGGQTKIALIGRPKGQASQFDLVVAPVHYNVPAAANVCRIGLPLLGIDEAKLAAAAETWRPRLARLARPLTVVLVGGSTGRRRFDPKPVQAIVAAAKPEGGGLYVATSRRTPADVIAALENALPPGAEIHRWQVNDPDNPYLALLALGDRFVVTGDSISMLVEVARLGKPLAIAAPPATSLGKLMSRIPILGGSRDFMLLHDFLYRGGWAVKLGDRLVKPPSLPPDDTAMAAERVRALL